MIPLVLITTILCSGSALRYHRGNRISWSEHCNYCEIVCPKKCINVIPDFSAERVYQTFDKYR